MNDDYVRRQISRHTVLDYKFWDVVADAIIDIVRLFGVGCHYEEKRSWDIDKKTLLPRDIRIIAVPDQAAPSIRGIYTFFADSPERFVPDGGLLIDSHPDTYTAFGKRELLLYLWRLAGGPQNEQMSGMCQMLEAIFRAEDSETNVSTEWLRKHPAKVRRARRTLEELYRQWYQYIARHYDRRTKGTTPKEKFDFQMRALCAKHARDIGAIPLDIYSIFSSLLLVDGTLCHIEMRGETCSIPWGSAISSEFLKDQLSKHMLKKKYLPDIKGILSLHQKVLQKEEAQEKKWQKERTDAVPILCFSFAGKQGIYDIYYDQTTHKFSCQRGEAVWRPTLKQVHINPTEISVIPKPFLYQIVGGNWGQLRLLAKATCYAMSTQKLFRGAIVSDFEHTKELVVLLKILLGMDQVRTATFRQISKAEMMDTLIADKINGQLIGVSYEDNKRQLNPEQWERLRKLFNGSPIKRKDAILGEKGHNNTMQWFVIGNDETRMQLKKEGVRTINGPQCRLPDRLSEEDEIQLAQGELWMQIILPLWGFLLLKERVKEDDSEITTLETVHLFVKSCCQLDIENGDFLPARELYTHYTEFCRLHQRTDILKFKDFNDVLETEYKQKRVQWHHEKNKNPTGFFSIRFLGIPDQAICDLTPSPDDQHLFFERLDQITDIVKDHFVEWPFAEWL